MDLLDVVRLTGVPMPLRWSGSPLPVQPAENSFTITTGPRTDWFVDPATGEVTATGSALLGAAPHQEFTLAAQVSVDFASGFDAGALVARLAPDHWAKLRGIPALHPRARTHDAGEKGRTTWSTTD